ncbi:MAG: cell division protein FtsQ/DivIB [Akkermansia sp.]
MTEGGSRPPAPPDVAQSHNASPPFRQKAGNASSGTEARKETIERKGKPPFWLFRRKLYHIVTVYAYFRLNRGYFSLKDYILKYDWLSIDTVTLNSNGIFNAEQAFAVMGIGPQDNIFSIDASVLEQRLQKCPAIRRADVKYQVSSNPTLIVDIDARIPAAWIDCPELGIHPGDAKYGVLADKDGVMFPCMETIHMPYIQEKKLPSVSLRPPSSGQLAYGVRTRDLEAPMQLIELLSGAVSEFLPGIVSISTPNDWSFCVRFSNDCQATFSHYGLEHQVEKLSAPSGMHARRTAKSVPST